MPHDRILIVDDDAAVRVETAAALAQRNYRPSIAYDVRDAISRLESDGAFDVVISEVVLNGMDGAQMIQRMQAACPGIPIIVVTSLRDIHAAIISMRSGAFDYLLKPVEPGTLLDAVERAVEHSHQSR